MKKLLILISFIGISFASQAQSSTSTGTTSGTSATVTDSKDKTCHGVTKDCPMPCTGDKASATLSSSQNNAGAVASAPEKKMSKKECKKQMASCQGHSGSCCEGMSKAKASSESSSDQNIQAPSQGTEVSPKK